MQGLNESLLPLTAWCMQATDELISRGPLQLPYFSARIASLAAYTQAHPQTLLVDPLEKVQQVMSTAFAPFDCELNTRCILWNASKNVRPRTLLLDPLESAQQVMLAATCTYLSPRHVPMIT